MIRETTNLEIVSKRTIAILGTAGLLGLAGVVILWLFAKQESRLKEIQLTGQEILTRLRDAQSAQRGYILTGDPTYLQPFDGSRDDVRRELSRLKDLTHDNRFLNTTEDDANKEFDVLEQSIRIRRFEGFQSAQVVVYTGRGKKFLENFTTELAQWEQPFTSRLRHCAKII